MKQKMVSALLFSVFQALMGAVSSIIITFLLCGGINGEMVGGITVCNAILGFLFGLVILKN